MKEEITSTSSHKQSFSKLALASLILAALGICVPIGWDYWKTKTELTVRLSSKLPLFATDSGFEKLRIYYGSNEVRQVTRFNFIFENTGHTPIQQHDVVVPIQLCLTNGCNFIDSTIDKLEPTSVTAKATLTDSNRTLQLEFPLVNPSDKITFSGLVSGTNPSIFLQSRVVGLREMRFIDESSPNFKGGMFSAKNIRTIVAIASFGLILLLKRARSEQRQARMAMVVIEGDAEKLSKYTKKTDFLNYVRGRLDPFILRIDRQEIISKIEALVAEEGVSLEVKPLVIEAIKSPIQDTIRVNSTGMKVIVICIIGGMAALIRLLL